MSVCINSLHRPSGEMHHKITDSEVFAKMKAESENQKTRIDYILQQGSSDHLTKLCSEMLKIGTFNYYIFMCWNTWKTEHRFKDLFTRLNKSHRMMFNFIIN